MINWTKLATDPFDLSVRYRLPVWLLTCMHDLPNNDFDQFLVSTTEERSLLDTGICECIFGRMNLLK